MSGHSKWSQIKHKKGAADKKKGQLFSKLVKQITIAARDGTDTESNFKLRLATEQAKASQMPKDTIDRAIEKASGTDGMALSQATYEGYGPAGSAFIIEVATDSKNRASSEIRHILEKRGGSLGQPNSVAWNFESKGEILARGTNLEELELMAIEAGAEDVRTSKEGLEVYTLPVDLAKIKKILEEAGAIIESAEVALNAKNTVGLTDADKKTAQALYEELSDHDDVINVYTSAEL
jgi:YebC/PmpR family DNA-binding regulatory protein